MSGRTFTPLSEAGPLRLPAAIVHPDDALPKTWRLFSTWSHRGQQGAWLVREEAGLPMWDQQPRRNQRRPPGRSSYGCREPDAVQIVYRRTAPRRRASHIGHALANASSEGTYICDLDKVREQARLKIIRAAQASVRAHDVAPATPPTPLSAPPEPGLGRARWLGERITTTTAVYSPKLAPHAKRRAAARDALALINGYTASRAESDALYFTSASLYLTGLNEYARRVLDEGEAPHVGADDEEVDHAVL